MAKLFLGTKEVSNVIKLINTQALNITPTVSAQIITATGGTGYSPVNVSAVTSAIDSNIIAGNIKKNVTILGVTGSYETEITTLHITPTTSAQTITAIEGTGYSPVTVEAVTSSIDSNITAGNLKKGVSILGVTGTLGGNDFVILDREVSANGVYQMPATNFTFSLPSNATDVGTNAMREAFRGCTGLTSADLSSLTTVSGSYAMDSAFYYCTSLTSVDLSSLTTISGSSAMTSAFQGCTGLTSVDLSSLTTISGSSAMPSAFQGCTKLTTLSFPALTSTSFGSYTNQFNSMLQGVTGCTVHFPSNLQSVIGSWSSVTSGFGGTNTTVLFDLPATT